MKQIEIETVVDAVMAVGGIEASLRETGAVIGDHLADAVTRLVPGAAALVAAETGMEFTVGASTLGFETEASTHLLELAVIRHTLALIVAGTDRARAQAYRDLAAEVTQAIAAGRAGTSPPVRPCSWW